MRILLVLLISGSLLSALGQVPKTIVVEHFTNSECSICATKNPGFYTNLNMQSEIIHIAVHPSSPYDYCYLNLNNVAENDDRTNYYGIYGGTPRLVIQGDVISSGANYSDSGIFSPYVGQTSPASIRIQQTIFNENYVKSAIVIKTVDAHTLGALKLFVALTEDTVFYEGGNGEAQHYDVFRKSLSATTGTSVILPETIGDSIVVYTETPLDSEWNVERLQTIAILQESDSKDVVQSFMETMFMDSITVPNNINNFTSEHLLTITPNPTGNQTIRVVFQNAISGELKISDNAGRVLLQQSVESGNTINVSELLSGQYIVTVRTTNAVYVGRFIKL